MAAFEPTSSQREAIRTRGSSVLVSAGAGSGKTKVLTERLIAYITDPVSPVDIDSFLIITYTKAAAGELRGRIMDEVAKALESDPGNKRLRRQSALCVKAQIGTIHSFCNTLLKEHCHEIGLSPDFRIADEDRAAEMKRIALENVMEEFYSNPEEHPGFSALADSVGAGRDDRRLTALVQNLYDKMQCHARPEKWANEQVELLNAPITDAGSSIWGRELLDNAEQTVAFWITRMEQAVSEMTECEKISAAYEPSFSEVIDQLRNLQRCLKLGWDRTTECFPIVYPKLKQVRNSPDPELSERVKTTRDQCKKATESLAQEFSLTSGQLLNDLKDTSEPMKALLDLTMAFEARYAQDKRKNSLMDYSDLEHFAARLLTDEEGNPTQTAIEVSQKYTEIMVDEYQDVSRVQDTIFTAISNERRNLFMVGDVKQSIYGFRLADPEIFIEKYESYPYAAEAGEGESRKILLRENFRSRKEILNAANSVFSVCMSKRLGDVEYDEDAALVHGASYYEGEVPVPEFVLLPKAKETSEEELVSDKAGEARWVAEKIRELMQNHTMIGSGDNARPLEYGDIAILLRSMKNTSEEFRKVLTEYGIPVASESSGEFYETMEVTMVMSLIAVVDNPHQDIPLLTVLRSPAFGFTPDELAEIRIADGKADLYGALNTAAETSEKCRTAVERIAELRALAPDLLPSQMVWKVINELNLTAICSAMNDGVQRKNNLLKLVEQAEKYEATGYKGLHKFVLWVGRVASGGKGPASGNSSDAAVRILSIHKSKGLEFPVVFISCAAKQFNLSDSNDTVLIHPEMGLGPKKTDIERHICYPTLARIAIAQRIRRETLAEELRLLYVAMTRPKERMYITATVAKPEEKVMKLSSQVTVPMDPEILYKATDFATWLIYAAAADESENLKLTIASGGTNESPVADSVLENTEDTEMLQELERRLSFQYEYAAVEKLPSKVTATEIKGRYRAEDEDTESLLPKRHKSFRMPDFAKKDKPLTGAERGTAVHLVFQNILLKATENTSQITSEINRMLAENILTPKETASVSPEAILKFFQSPIGERMKKASDTLEREFRFTLLLDAQQIYREVVGEKLLFQGVIDAFFEEEDGIVIVDYKTDAIRSQQDLEERTKLYRGQLLSYAEAIGRIMGKPVKECVLYFLQPCCFVPVPLK